MDEVEEKSTLLGILIISYLFALFIVLPVIAGWMLAGELSWVGIGIMAVTFIIWELLITVGALFFNAILDEVLPFAPSMRKDKSQECIAVGIMFLFLTLWALLLFYTSQKGGFWEALHSLVSGFAALSVVLAALAILAKWAASYYQKRFASS